MMRKLHPTRAASILHCPAKIQIGLSPVLVAGHFLYFGGISLNADVLAFLREFGLILFIYSMVLLHADGKGKDRTVFPKHRTDAGRNPSQAHSELLSA